MGHTAASGPAALDLPSGTHEVEGEPCGGDLGVDDPAVTVLEVVDDIVGLMLGQTDSAEADDAGGDLDEGDATFPDEEIVFSLRLI